MKAKTISQVIRKKVDEWLETVDDEVLREHLKANVIVTGGCIASMLLREPVNDFDIYFKTKYAAIQAAQYYVARFKPRERNRIECKIYVVSEDDRVKIVIKSAGIASEDGTTKAYEYFESPGENERAADYVGDVMRDPGEIQETFESTKAAATYDDEDGGGEKYRPVFMSTNAITLSNRVQLVLRFFGDPDTIHANYDFVHCTNYWTSQDSRLVLRQPALEAILARELIYVGSKYPVCSIIRLRKFIKRNWTINAGQILKMCMQVSALDLTNIEVLQDQLTGVDCAYFAEVIGKLKEGDPEKINAAYLCEIVDRMF